MTDWPDPDFRLYSANSREGADQTDGTMLAEVERTIADLPAFQQARRLKGLLDPAGAEREAATWRAIAEDLRDAHDPDETIDWRAKVDLLRAEIAHRRTVWPDDIAKGLRQRAGAIERLAAIEAVHDRYWSWGWHMGLPAARAFHAFLTAHRGELDEDGQGRLMDAAAARIAEIKGQPL